MAQPILADTQESIRPLEDQIRECFGRVVYSHKAHEKTADIYVRRLARIKLGQIGLAAVTTGGLILVLFGSPENSNAAAVMSALLSTILLVLNSYNKDVDLGQIAERHKEIAARLWSIRESYLSILTDIRIGSSTVDEVKSRRDNLQSELATIYSAAPRTLDAAYRKAGIALKQNEELTFSEQEIDRFLPQSLRRS
jgi:hypothetical protein